MSLTLNTNLSSLNAQRNLAGTSNMAQTAMQRLSSGMRVNSAKDDAAGLAIGSKMESQVRGFNQAVRNTNDGISMLQTADSSLQTISNIFQRMRELTVQAANATVPAGSEAATAITSEYTALSDEVTRIASNTKFNGETILDGTYATGSEAAFQVGADDNTNTFDQIEVAIGDATAYLTAGATLDNSTALAEMTKLDTALETLNEDRATIGAALSKFDFTVSNLQAASENQAAARSRIMDADYSQESANLAKSQVLQQAGIAMLAQANQQPQQILSLLR